jgi:four helix bundle protein
MPTIKKFENLDCWKEARILVNDVYKLTKRTAFWKDFGLRDQIQRAAVSAMTNIAEGFGRYSGKEFIRFLDYTQSSCEEVKSLLYVAYDQKYITEDDLKEGYKKASDVRNLSLALIKYLRKSEKKSF